MSQLLQIHINQRLLKSHNQSGDNSPASPMLASPGTLSPLSMGPSSPQGMPIPRRVVQQDPQHWLLNGSNGLMSNPNFVQSGWNTMNTNVFDQSMEAAEALLSNNLEMDPMSMEGELSKLSMAVDDDDIFKVDRGDLLEPTLAELNAPDADTLLDGLNFDDLYWPADAVPPLEATPSPQTPAGANPLDPDGDLGSFQVPSSSFPPLATTKLLPGTSMPVPAMLDQTMLQQPALTLTSDIGFVNAVPATTNNPPPQPSTSSGGGLRELLLRRDLLQNSLESPDPSPLGQSLPRSMLSPSPGPGSPRLSSSAPSGQGNNAWESWQQRREAMWTRRDPRPHLLSTGSLAEAGSTSSIDVLSPARDFSLSMDEGFDSDDPSDRDSSDEESEVSDTESNAGSTSGARARERYFWQYNVQAKGPKGQRLILAPTQEDPHVLHRPTDPVFSPLCHIQGIKHSGKARKGDGNDLTPNPRKLWAIGKELDRLNKIIAEMTPVADLPNAVKSRSRKEKNKLASRACRLKKKAQHEANKLKLYGLEQEHKRLISAIDQARQTVFSRLDGKVDANGEPLAVSVERISKSAGHRIGGHTTEFVNKIVEKVKLGVPDGGISEL